MYQLPVREDKMRYVVKGNCIVSCSAFVKGKSLWWNMFSMADHFGHIITLFKNL